MDHPILYRIGVVTEYTGPLPRTWVFILLYWQLLVAVGDLYLVRGNPLVYEMIVNIYVFCTRMQSLRIRGCNHALVVDEEAPCQAWFKSVRSHAISDAAALAVMYSASVLDFVTVCCLREAQVIGAPARWKTWPKIDLQSSKSLAWLVSE